jgi:large subunit ribosomal protein L27e
MNEKKITKRIASMKCFVKYMNVNHMMPTRYTVNQNLNVKQIFKEPLKEAGAKHLTLAQRTDLTKLVRTHFMEKYREPQAEGQSNLDFFFSKLRF